MPAAATTDAGPAQRKHTNPVVAIERASASATCIPVGGYGNVPHDGSGRPASDTYRSASGRHGLTVGNTFLSHESALTLAAAGASLFVVTDPTTRTRRKMTTPDEPSAGNAREETGAHPNHRPAASLPAELRRTGVPLLVRDWIRRQLGAQVVATHRLAGASSTAVHLLALSDGRRVVLRRYAWPGFLEDEPIAVRREIDALDFARSKGLPAPKLLAVDVDGRSVGDGVPVVVMERLPGRPSRSVDVLNLAETAAALHDVAPRGLAHRYFRWFDDVAYRVPRNATDPALWQWALDVWSQPLPPFEPVFIHRDFHPGNVLWLRRRVSGVVDWANACAGPAACDISTCRGDLMRIAGPTAADALPAAYRAVTGCDLDPYWEVVGVLEHGPSPWSDAAIAVSEYRLRAARTAYEH